MLTYLYSDAHRMTQKPLSKKQGKLQKKALAANRHGKVVKNRKGDSWAGNQQQQHAQAHRLRVCMQAMWLLHPRRRF